jgi:hypothetical protein
VEPAGSVLQKIFRDLLARVPAEEAPLLAWPVVCGATVAARTRTLDFANGTLRVQVPDPAWKVQLTEMAPRYIAALSGMPGERVERIEFVVAGRQ